MSLLMSFFFKEVIYDFPPIFLPKLFVVAYLIVYVRQIILFSLSYFVCIKISDISKDSPLFWGVSYFCYQVDLLCSEVKIHSPSEIFVKMWVGLIASHTEMSKSPR